MEMCREIECIRTDRGKRVHGMMNGSGWRDRGEHVE